MTPTRANGTALSLRVPVFAHAVKTVDARWWLR
jgi:hypothetical protein